jgi:hypothetical protein
MVFLEAKNLAWSSILSKFFISLPKILEKYSDTLLMIIKNIFDAGLSFINKYGKFPMQYSGI